MADIDLQRKERGGLAWLWALLALLLLALIVWWLWPDDDAEVMAPGEDVEMVEPAPETEPTSVVDVGIAQILANPEQWIGRTFPDTRATVAQEMTDRGFFIEDQGQQLLVILIDQPEEEPLDINPQQTVRITDGTLRSPDYLGQIPGDPLEADTEQLVRDQEIFLVVDERNISILEGGVPQEGTDPAEGVIPDTMQPDPMQ